MKNFKKIFTLIFAGLFLICSLSISQSQEYKKHLNQGKEYLTEYYHKEKEALSEMKKAYSLNSEDFDVIYWLGRAYYENRKFEDAEPFLEKAVELKPNHLEANAYLSFTYGRIGENIIKRAIYMIKAAKQIKKVLAIDSKYADAYAALADSCTYLGWFGKPTGLFAQMLNIVFGEFKNTPEYKEIMKYESIPEGLFKTAAKLDKKNPWYPTCLGWAYLKMNKKDKAMKEFEKGLNLSAKEVRHGIKNDGVPRACAIYLEEAKMYDEALKYAKISLSWNPKDLCILPHLSIKRLIKRLEEEKKTGRHLLKNVADEL